MTKIILRKNLKELRDERDWSQDDLAESTGYTRGFIADIERGKSWVSPESLEKIAGALDVPIHRLFSTEDTPKRETLPVSRTLQKMMSVPDIVYDLAPSIPKDDEAWIYIEETLRAAKKRVEKIDKKNKSS